MRRFGLPGDALGWLLALAVAGFALPAVLLLSVWAATNVGTLVAMLLAGVVVVPPFVLWWGESRGNQSIWGWNPED